MQFLKVLERPFRECENIQTKSETDNTINIIFLGLGENEERGFNTPERFLEPALQPETETL